MTDESSRPTVRLSQPQIEADGLQMNMSGMKVGGTKKTYQSPYSQRHQGKQKV